MDVEFGWQGSHGGLVAYYGPGALRHQMLV